MKIDDAINEIQDDSISKEPEHRYIMRDRHGRVVELRAGVVEDIEAVVGPLKEYDGKTEIDQIPEPLPALDSLRNGEMYMPRDMKSPQRGAFCMGSKSLFVEEEPYDPLTYMTNMETSE